MLLDEGQQNGRCIEVIDRHVEKTLNLPGMKVHSYDPVRTDPGDQISHQTRRDRDPGLFFLSWRP